MLEMMQGAMGGGAGGGGGEVDSFVDTLMHGILCKDVLYEPLKVPPLLRIPVYCLQCSI